jgi:hypothetical protein
MPEEKPWHRALGALPDDAVALLHEQHTGEPLSSAAVKMARRRRDIPPFSEPHRSRWFQRRGEEWEAPPDLDLDW